MFAGPINELYPKPVESSPYFHSIFLNDSFIIRLSVPDLPRGQSLHAFCSEFCINLSHPRSATWSANLN